MSLKIEIEDEKGMGMEDDGEEDKIEKWEIEDALCCLKKAEKIKKNTALMEEVKKLASEEKQAITSIEQLKKLGNKISDDEQEDM